MLKITFDEPLDTNSLPDGGQFSVSVNGASVGLAAANAVAIVRIGGDPDPRHRPHVDSGSRRNVVFGDDVTVSYTVPTGTDPTPIPRKRSRLHRKRVAAANPPVAISGLVVIT